MRASILLASTLLAGVSSSVAVPHNHNHERFHQAKRDAAVSTATEYTTFYQTIVWVNKQGVPVSTEIRTPPPAIAAATHAPASPPQDYAPHGRPQSGAAPPSPPPAAATSTPPTQASAPLPASSSGAAAGGTQAGSGTSGTSGNAPAGMGVCYDMITSAGCKSPGTIASDFSFLKSQGYTLVRVYDIGCNVGDYVTAANSNGMKLMVGINAIANLQGDLGKLISMIGNGWSAVETVYIGNELVNTGAASAGAVAAAVTTARGLLSTAGFSGNVVTVDTFNQLQSDPTICSTSDFCAANTHAFFDPNTAAANAGNFVMNAFKSVQSANNGKRVVITESGWPYKGSCNGQACPSVENQKAAIKSIMSAFAGQPGSVMIFQAYDASYKGGGANGAEPFWGVYDADHYNGGIGPS